VNNVYHLNTISDFPMLHITQKHLLSKYYMQNVGYFLTPKSVYILLQSQEVFYLLLSNFDSNNLY